MPDLEIRVRPAAVDDVAAVYRLAAAHDVHLEGPNGLGMPYLDRLFGDGPHPALKPLLDAGFRIVERDTWCESPIGLVDPTRTVPDPSVGGRGAARDR